MPNTQLLLGEEGISIFKTPARLQVQVNRELAIVIYSAKNKLCTVIRHQIDRSLRDLAMELQTAINKLTEQYRVELSEVTLKIFGMSSPHKPTEIWFQNWVKAHSMRVTAEDMGKGVSRTLTIDCETGKIGVAYAETFQPTDALLLDSGTARQRTTDHTLAPKNALILTFNQVNRRLMTQIVEEADGWTTTAPMKPVDVMMAKDAGVIPALVILCDDVAKNKPAEKFVKQLLASSPHPQFVWVGAKPPAWSKKFVKFPKVQPGKLKSFKKEMMRLLHQLGAAENEAGSVLLFPVSPTKKKKAKRKAK